MNSDYIELRARSAFSFLEGATTPEDLAARAAELGYGAMALGDRDGLYGAPRFYQAAKSAGIRQIVGAELTLDDNSRLYVLAPDRKRYQNLCRMITDSKMRVLNPGALARDGSAASPVYPAKGESRITLDDLERYGRGLICLAGGVMSPLSRMLVRGEDPGDLSRRLGGIFGAGNFYIDLQRHLDAGEERLNRKLAALAGAARIPVVATNDVCHGGSDRRLLDVLTCIRLKTTLEEAGRALWINSQRHLKSPAEMAALFRDLPGAVAASRAIAERCAFQLSDMGYRFPDYPLPPGETADSYLRILTYAGARERWRGAIDDRTRCQLEHELGIVERLKLAGYFLIVWDIVQFCRENRIMVQGRGSAANSAVCYALGITAVDAVKMELLFERFLSEERGEWPDIDLDLPSGDDREKAIQYVYRRYGERGAAMTANVITYRTKSAVREVGKTLGFSPEQVDRLAKLNQVYEFRDHHDDLVALLKRGGVDAEAPRITMLADLVRRIQSVPRHLGQHSGGMVIAAQPLDEIVPLEPASMPGRVVIQWDKDDCADLGIIKIDLLGLGMLAALKEALPMIRAHEGVEIDLAHLPPDDPGVYAMLRRADTVGVFQVESRAQMATLPRMKPERFYDLVVEVAIIRPGPIVGKMVHPYLDRRNHRAPVEYPHPSLEPILKRTLGVPLFQEQLLRMAMTVAGFSGGEAEELRRAMGFKRSAERMEKIEARLRAGMLRNGLQGNARRRYRALDHILCALRLPRIARRQLRADRLRVGIPEASSSGGVRCRDAELLPARLLSSLDAGERRRPSRRRRATRRCDPLELEMHNRDCGSAAGDSHGTAIRHGHPRGNRASNRKRACAATVRFDCRSYRARRTEPPRDRRARLRGRVRRLRPGAARRDVECRRGRTRSQEPARGRASRAMARCRWRRWRRSMKRWRTTPRPASPPDLI